MARRAFIDPQTGVLKAHGYVATNEAGDVALDVPDDFDRAPGRWRWDGTQWVAVTPPAPTPGLTPGERALLRWVAGKLGVAPAQALAEVLTEVAKQ
jgi:hypothetical protein